MESTFRQGIIYSLTAYLLWGILPIYWKTLGVVQAFEILSNRFIWSCVFVWILIIASGRVKSFLAETQDIFTNPKPGCGNYDQFQLGVVYLGCQ